MKSQGITKVIMVRPVGTMNVCAKFQGEPFDSYINISSWTKVVE